MQRDLDSALIECILRAHHEGSPVAPSGEVAAKSMASVARRRWASHSRRNPLGGNTTDRCIDLARGLADAYYPGGVRMAGPLLRDYRWLAEQLALLLSGQPS